MSGGWGIFFLVFGVVVVVFTVGRIFRRKAGSGGGTGGGRGEGTSGGTGGGAGGVRSRGANADGNTSSPPDYEQSLKELDRHLERRIHTLETLIEEADERIQRLSKVVSRREVEVVERNRRGEPAGDIARTMGMEIFEVERIISSAAEEEPKGGR